ncbi:MAG: patatin-like phospholipase family protein [Steroidobacteraceae bacterium]
MVSRDDPADDLPEATSVMAAGDVLYTTRALPLLQGLAPGVIDEIAAEISWFTLPGGSTLFDRGEPPDAIYFVTAGSLGVMPAEDGATRPLARLGAGESVGEMGMISGRPRSARVVAMRDTVLGRLSREAFTTVLLRHPAAVMRFAALMAERITTPGLQARDARPRTIALVPHGIDVDVAGFAVDFVDALGGAGRAELVWSVRGGSHTSEWFHRIEARNDFVVYATDPGNSPWTRLCTRQADIVLLLARADGEPGPCPALEDSQFAAARSELVLLHDAAIAPGIAARWRERMPGVAHHHVRGEGDIARVARLLTGRSIGVVLSGGGARGFAHLGVVRALREYGIPIDRVGGTSMGAIMGAGVAADWSHEEMIERFRSGFVATNPLADFTLPIVSLVSGRKVTGLLKRTFGEIDIDDLPLPYFCVSANLTSGRLGVHDSGELWRWLRASLAIPGVLPPVFRGGEIYVDGATMNNLPVDVMQERRRGAVIGVDVGADKAFTTDLEETDLPPLWKLAALLGGRRHRPNILQILLRTGMVNSAAATAQLRQQSSLLLRPPLESIDLLNWRSFDRAIAIGYDYTRQVLDERGGTIDAA